MAMLCISVSLLIRHQRLTLMLPDHIQLVLDLLLCLGHHLRSLDRRHLFQTAEIVSSSKLHVYLAVLLTCAIYHLCVVTGLVLIYIRTL